MKIIQLKTIRNLSVGAVAVLSAMALTARAADTTDHGQLSAKDYKFATEAAQGGMMEVSLGQLAAQKGSDQAVRDFGKRMQDDHQKADDELKAILAQKGAGYPQDIEKKDQRMVEHLNNLSGADFDKTYMKDMVSGHKKDVKDFQDEASEVQDPDLKAWVNKTLPTVQSHLQQAQGIETTVDSRSGM